MTKETHRKPSPEILQRVARNLKRLRAERQMTQEQVAEKCGLTKTYIGNVEQTRANVCLSSLETIGAGLDCEPWELVSRQYDHLQEETNMKLIVDPAIRKARGKVLARAMAAKNLTQRTLERQSGVSRATIGRLLRGEVDPRAGTLIDICQALSISLDVFFED